MTWSLPVWLSSLKHQAEHEATGILTIITVYSTNHTLRSRGPASPVTSVSLGDEIQQGLSATLKSYNYYGPHHHHTLIIMKNQCAQ